jgi:hypothetical protein
MDKKLIEESKHAEFDGTELNCHGKLRFVVLGVQRETDRERDT